MNSSVSSQPVRPLRFPWAQLQPPRHCVPAGSSALAVPQESRGQPGWEHAALFKERSLFASFSMTLISTSLINHLTQGSGAQGGDSCGIAKCRNPLGPKSELVRRKPAESVRLERRIPYKQAKMNIHSLNFINTLLSTSSSVSWTLFSFCIFYRRNSCRSLVCLHEFG